MKVEDLKKGIEERIEELEHGLLHADETIEQQLKDAQLQANVQLAEMRGRLVQQKASMQQEVSRLRELIGEGLPQKGETPAS